MKKYRMLLCGLVIALAAVSLAGCGNTDSTAPEEVSHADEAVTKEDILGGGVTDENTYLLKAMHAGFTENNETVFETIDGDKIVPGKYEPDNLYLLTMFTNQTDDRSDDEVSVVWSTAQPME